jgi:antirestriction protein ArdC
MKRDLYVEVSARIVAELKAGAAPWIKPWSATAGMNTPCNAVTNRPYSGCNVVLLWMARGRLSHAAFSDVQTSVGVGRPRP